MKQTITLALVFIAIIAALGAWHAFGAAAEPTQGSAPEPSVLAAPTAANPGGTVAQVIEKIIPKAPLAPEIASKTWFNSSALATQDLRGRVVVVEFWTFG